MHFFLLLVGGEYAHIYVSPSLRHSVFPLWLCHFCSMALTLF